jgi:hypothetical protein
MKSLPDLNDLGAEWRAARVLYPVYSALAREFVIDTLPCDELDEATDAPPQETVEKARRWFEEMDARVQVHQLRQFLQTSPLVNDVALRTLLEHHLRKPQHSESDRDKADFLLVQYFSHCAPSRLEDADVDPEYVAQTLESVLGRGGPLSLPNWIDPLEEFLTAARGCQTLHQLLNSGILEKGRKLKVGSGEEYFSPQAMAAFTRFNFLMRRIFFRLMHQDLNAILDGLRQLEDLGVNTLDCRRAQFSAEEPTIRLRMICQSWKVMFHAEYSSGQPLKMLVDLRGIVDTALARAGSSAKPPAKAQARAHAASAAMSFSSSGDDVPEFDVSASVPWDPDDPSKSGESNGGI